MPPGNDKVKKVHRVVMIRTHTSLSRDLDTEGVCIGDRSVDDQDSGGRPVLEVNTGVCGISEMVGYGAVGPEVRAVDRPLLVVSCHRVSSGEAVR